MSSSNYQRTNFKCGFIHPIFALAQQFIGSKIAAPNCSKLVKLLIFFFCGLKKEGFAVRFKLKIHDSHAPSFLSHLWNLNPFYCPRDQHPLTFTNLHPVEKDHAVPLKVRRVTLAELSLPLSFFAMPRCGPSHTVYRSHELNVNEPSRGPIHI